MQHLLERYAYESVNTTRIIETFGKDLPARKSIIQYIEEDLSYYCKAMQINCPTTKQRDITRCNKTLF